ncbi:MAG: aminoacyl-tRNA hydrolase [Alphaproteobacteria bacterium]|nr:aminoacyl-tRNA hydrolase [Alphaproteobacteria bacterium]
MLLVAGLGNPGPEYEGNRHNVGYLAIDAIAKRHGLGPSRRRFQGKLAEGEIAGVRILLLKPMTYMNRSGDAITAATAFYKITPARVLVIHDELDLEFGKVRAKTGGGTAGHNGLRSIDSHIGPGFRRIRIGIGRPESKDDVLNYVLQDFAKAECEPMGRVVAAVAEAFPLIVAGHDAEFMTKVALLTQPERPKPPKGVPPADGV